jgi:PAS domain S-box-containing protein
MAIDPHAEILRLRTALRDLVALSSIPAAWVGRDPPAIAAGLADVLVGSLHLDFAFVRLCDPNGGAAVEVTEGNAWKAFPEWLERHLTVVGQFSRKEIIPDVGGGAEPCRGIVIPVGVNAEGGLVAAACDRTDFPTEIDQLLLSVAANHAATAFQSARLIHERKRAEEELRQARNELEMKVAERTAELRRATAELETILNASPVGIALFGREQTVQRSNPAFERILGWRADEIAGRPMPVPSGHQEEWSALAQRLHRGEAFAHVETRLLRKDGAEFDAAVACAPLQDEAGRASGFVGTIQDISDRKRAEEALRRSEAYLAEAQRLSHTGSWAWNVATREIVHWSQELYRMHGVDPEGGIPPFEAVIQSIHPEDRARAIEIQERAIREKTEFEVDFRTVLPNGAMQYLHGVGHPVFNASGDVVEIVGTAMDVTERQRADDERLAHLWFLESLDRINRAMQGTNDLEQMMSDVLDAVLSIFACDRAWLVYPCDPEAPSWRAAMEQTRPEFPGAFALGIDLPMDPEVANVFRSARGSSGAVRFGPGSDHPVPAQLAERFSIQSVIGMAVYPKVDQPYLFGLHQCSYPRVWTPQEERLLREIDWRLADALTSLLMFRSLRESERKLEEAQRMAHVGYWDRDFDAGRITLSDETCRIFGLPLEERIVNLARWHEQLQELIHPEDQLRTAQATADALRGGPRYDVEYRVVRPNGEVRIVHSRGDVTWDESGRPRRMFGTMQDITELRQAEDELRASEDRFRTLVDHATDAFFLHGEQGTILDVNRQACESLGYSREELIGMTTLDFDVDVDPTFVERIWERLAAGEIIAFDTRHRRKDGTVFPVEVRARPFRQGGRRFTVSLVRDITERKRAEAALHHAQAELAHVTRVATLGELTASIAHEVNQPLAAVVINGNACLRWLTREPPNLEEAREAVRRMIRDGDRAGEVIARIRALVRKAEPQKAPLAINGVITEVIALADSEVRRNRVVLKTDLAANLPPVLADRIQLQQVLLNLLLNGIDALRGVTDRPRELIVRSQPEEAAAIGVAVEDAGVGIDSQDMDRIFTAFFTTKPAGLGMGLPISRSIIEAHGGRLWATPNAGPGVTVQFTLPIGEAGAS